VFEFAQAFMSLEGEAEQLEMSARLNCAAREILSNAICHVQGVYVRTAGLKPSSVPEGGFEL
jgi:hypothetical protein